MEPILLLLGGLFSLWPFLMYMHMHMITLFLFFPGSQKFPSNLQHKYTPSFLCSGLKKKKTRSNNCEKKRKSTLL